MGHGKLILHMRSTRDVAQNANPSGPSSRYATKVRRLAKARQSEVPARCDPVKRCVRSRASAVRARPSVLPEDARRG